jgi:hypothetical protein
MLNQSSAFTFSNGEVPLDPGRIKAIADANAQKGLIWLTGITVCLMIVSGMLVISIANKPAFTVWAIIGPIISSTLTLTIPRIRPSRP